MEGGSSQPLPDPKPRGGRRLPSQLGARRAPAPTPQPGREAGPGIRKEAAPHSRRQLGCPGQPDRAPFTRAGETLSVVLGARQWERRPSHLLPWLSGGGKGQLQLLPKGTQGTQGTQGTRSQLSHLGWSGPRSGSCSGPPCRGRGGVLGAETPRGGKGRGPAHRGPPPPRVGAHSPAAASEGGSRRGGREREPVSEALPPPCGLGTAAPAPKPISAPGRARPAVAGQTRPQ